MAGTRRGAPCARISAKTRRSRLVQVPEDVLTMVIVRKPREDRDGDAQVFRGLRQANLRTDLYRACKRAGVERFGLHALRHRRLSMWPVQGVPIAEISKRAGHARSSMTLDVYAHVIADDRAIDRAAALARAAVR